MSIWNWWARSHRNARALAAAGALAVAIVAMGFVRCRETMDPVIARDRERAVVIAVAPGLAGSSTHATLVVAAGDTLRLHVPAPAPAVGDAVPLRVELRDSGRREYTVDRQAWLTGDF